MKYILTMLLITAIAPFSFAGGSKDKHVKAQSVEFEKGSAALTQDHKSKISEMVQKAKGDEKNLDIAVWSDQPFPTGEQELSKDQQELAENRVKAIKDYVDTLEFEGNMETYNMAERSNWLARTFNTEESELKSIFAKEGVEAGAMQEKYEAFKNEGEPSKAVFVMSKDKDKQRAQDKDKQEGQDKQTY